MAKSRVQDAESIEGNIKTAAGNLGALTNEIPEIANEAAKLKELHRIRLNERRRINEVLTEPDAQKTIEDRGIIGVLEAILEGSIGYGEDTQIAANKIGDDNVYLVTNPRGVDISVINSIDRLRDALGLEKKYNDAVAINADELRGRLLPILRAEPEERRALLEKLWAERDVAEITADEAQVAPLKQRAAFLRQALGQTQSAKTAAAVEK